MLDFSRVVRSEYEQAPSQFLRTRPGVDKAFPLLAKFDPNLVASPLSNSYERRLDSDISMQCGYERYDKVSLIGADQSGFLHIKNIKPFLPQELEHVNRDVLVCQQMAVAKIHAPTSARTTTSFSRKREAYRIACSMSSFVKCG